jgi:hypothetical protein
MASSRSRVSFSTLATCCSIDERLRVTAWAFF